jgi:hypothetical protein
MIASNDNKFDVSYNNKDFAQPTFSNQTSNIIAGPNTKPWNSGLMYFSHSPGDSQPLMREEGPLPVQGNIGQLVKDEYNSYNKCGSGISKNFNISGSKNCTSAFYADTFTTEDTCGDNCMLSSPESFGGKDFGFDVGDKMKYTNSHGLHAYQNIRAGAEGQSSNSGCYEFIPGMASDSTGTCMLDPKPVYQQVGDWTKLKENKSIISSSFNNSPKF